MKSLNYKIPLLAVLFILLSTVNASAAATFEELVSAPQVILIIVISMTIFVILVIIFLILALDQFLQTTQEDGKLSLSFASLFSDWSGKLNNAVPIEQEEEVMTDHVYDGIRELDNQLPTWWVWLFNLTIVFAVVYLVWFHVLDKGKLQIQEYKDELAVAAAQKKARMAAAGPEASVDENTVTALTSKVKLTAGKEIFTNYCAACHGQAGEGKVGPNLTDVYWLHGGGIKNVFKTIKYGVPQKGMISWENQLSPAQIQEVASYILTLQGTNPPNAKAPQGDKYVEGQEVAVKN